MSSGFSFERVEEPDDEQERELLRHIRDLQQMHAEQLRPLIDAYARSRACKPASYFVRVDDPAKLAAVMTQILADSAD